MRKKAFYETASYIDLRALTSREFAFPQAAFGSPPLFRGPRGTRCRNPEKETAG